MGQVLVLDDDDDLLGSIADVLRVIHARSCLAVHSFDDMVAHGEEALASDVALLDINLGPDQPSGLDAFRWLAAHKFAGRVVFVTGHAESHPLVAEVQRLAGWPVLRKPFAVDELARALRS